MLRKVFRVILVAVVCFIAMPAANTSAATSGSCEACRSAWDYETNGPTVRCDETRDGETGLGGCKIECWSMMNFSTCNCAFTGHMCMMIVVRPD